MPSSRSKSSADNAQLVNPRNDEERAAFQATFLRRLREVQRASGTRPTNYHFEDAIFTGDNVFDPSLDDD